MYALRYLVKPHPFQMHLIFCTIFSIFSTLWPLAWPFAMQISLLLFKIGGESRRIVLRKFRVSTQLSPRFDAGYENGLLIRNKNLFSHARARVRQLMHLIWHFFCSKISCTYNMYIHIALFQVSTFQIFA